MNSTDPLFNEINNNGTTIPVWSGQDLRVTVGSDSQISRQSAHEGGKFVSATHQPHLPTSKYLWHSFLLEAESTAGPQRGRKEYVNEKFQLHHRESNPRQSKWKYHVERVIKI